MDNKHFSCLVILSLALFLMLAGCGGKATQAVQQVDTNAGARETEIANTVIAQITQTAAAFTPPSVPTATSESILPSPTSTEVPPTSTEVPPTFTAVPVEPTSTPQVTPTPRSETSGTRIWQDDFEGVENWFSGFKEDSYTFEFLKGAYRIYNNLLGAIVWSIRSDNYTDIRLEVDVMRQNGPKDGYFGLICRYVDSKNYYALVMGDDATAKIVKMENSKLSFIQQDAIPDNVLNDKNEYNRLRADCIGSSLALYVNDKKVIETQDSGFASGDVGIGVGNQLKGAGIDVIFDNFEIWQP
jgi:hypothetical protein